MEKQTSLQLLKGGLIVSCQALENEPLFSSFIMSKMALAAKLGGACAIRANTPVDIVEIKKEVNLPIIGLFKKVYDDSSIYITPTMKEVDALVCVGTNIIATDFTNRLRPNGVKLEEFIKNIREKHKDLIIMADISTYEEGKTAEELGADIISTTLSGYTPYSPQQVEPDMALIEKLVKNLNTPIIAEGRIHTPENAKKALELGAYSVVVGGAITRPTQITQSFVNAIMK